MTVDLERLEALLLELLATPSYAGEETAVAAIVERRLCELGFTVERDNASIDIGGACDNLIARLPGTTDAPALFLNAHLDTVGRTDGLTPVLRDGIIQTNGQTVLGGDDKTGVTAILEGVAAALAAGVPRPPLELVFTVQEETGLHGARVLELGQFAAPFGFVFDGGVPLGRMTISAPYHAHQTITLHGRASHAGVAPEEGCSAIVCAGHAVAGLQVGRIDDETTCNLGTVAGGTARNIVPDRCVIESEIRSRDAAKLERVAQHFLHAFERAADDFGCRIEFEHRVLYDGFRIDPDEPVARLARAAVEAAGLAPSFVDGGGGSDANVFCAKGLRCILMPCGQQQPHTPDEHCAVADVAAAARVVAELVRLAGEPR